jgi:hypothetical protein
MPVTIDKPEGYFNTVLWTGNNSSPRDIATGHATDFIWVKFRANPYNHRLFDNVRGGSKKLISNNTDAEDTGATGDVTGFISTGFTIGSNINNSADGTLVGWSWKANGTGSSNTAGSITSTVSANTTSGFSIVSWTGTGATGTIGHGLGSVPKMIIVKNRSAVADWYTYHQAIGNGNSVFLNLSDASTATNAWQSTTPTSSLFYIAAGSSVNGSGNNMIAYCFAEIKGFSKFGKYTGNGSTDGTFVYTGFKPAFVMLKSSSSGAVGWITHDNKRIAFNPNNYYVEPNNSNAESADTDKILLLSNGFKLISTSASWNSSGGTYIYMAFAENPFVSSKGIPTTAR